MVEALIIEDDRSHRLTLARALNNLGMGVREAATFLEGDLALRQNPDFVLLDLGLPDGDGRELLHRSRSYNPSTPVIVVSGADDFESTVRAIQSGAYDYLFKPVDLDELAAVIDSALAERQARTAVRMNTRQPGPVRGLVGRTEGMRRVYKQIASAAPSGTNVLVRGETGVGKELVARAIHSTADNRDEPFHAVNCAVLSRGLLASQLFGHARGAFTGAVRDHAGWFESVGEGTLFLDEVGELAPALQSKLLRVLQERMFERTGETKTRHFKGRLITATNRDLLDEVSDAGFRADLYYRISVVEIVVPPLRERIEDLPALCEALLPAIAEETGCTPLLVPPPVIDELSVHDWPGNVRELRNLLQRMTVLARGRIATQELLAEAGFRPTRLAPAHRGGALQSLASLEAEHIDRVLCALRWHKTRAARILGISRPTLDRKIKQYDLQPRWDGIDPDAA